MKFKQWDNVIYKPRGESRYILVKIWAVLEATNQYHLQKYESKLIRKFGDGSDEFVMIKQDLPALFVHWDAVEETAIKVTNDNLESITLMYL